VTNSHLKTLRINRYSLQSQYLIFAGILGIIITISIFFSYQKITESYQSLVENTKITSEIRNQVAEIRNDINALSNGIDVVMLQPEYKDQVELLFISSFTNLEQILFGLSDERYINEIDISGEISDLSFNLIEFQDYSVRLLEIRTDVNQQYPSMALSSQIMRPASNRIFTVLELALREYSEDGNINELESYYKLLVNLKEMWGSIVSEYRLYLANRIGSFNEEQLFEQEIGVEDSIKIMEKMTIKLLDYSSKFGFESAEIMPELPNILAQWKDGFLSVKEIHHSDYWRQDTELMRSTIIPLLDEINISLSEIDNKIEVNDSGLVNKYGEIGNWQTMLLIAIAITFVAYSFITYVFLRKLIFNPLEVLARSIRLNHIDVNSHDIEQLGKTKETKVLIDAFLAMQGDVKKRQDELSYQALHDALTSLPNRKLLIERLRQDIKTAQREGSPLSFLMLDLNGFKDVNDTLGHHVGDHLLIQVGERIQAILRDVDTIARLGGDEFSIILNHTNRNDAAIVANKVNDVLEKDFVVDDCVLHVGTSIGITEYPEDGDNVNDLMKHADIAMYKSKKNKSDYNFYNPEDDEHSIQRLSMSSDLRNVIENNDIELNYQPKLNISTGEVIGLEVLLRWNHEECGYIPPEKIIEIAENIALIDDLTMLIFENAVKDILLLRESYPQISLAVNLSVHNLKKYDFCEKVKAIIEYYEVDPKTIIFELTESSMMANPNKSIEMLNKLTELGVKISIDDFGTGFSSLTYLKKLPVSELKIDRSFVMDIITDNNDAVIVKSTVDLAHNLGLAVVAEGVESEKILTILQSMGCDSCQGYFFTKPLKFDDVVTWLSTYSNTRR